jgi:hypothetical protein
MSDKLTSYKQVEASLPDHNTAHAGCVDAQHWRG